MVAINRAIAVAEVDGPAAGLDALAVVDAGAVEAYQPFHAARADLLARAGETTAALAAYDRAIELTTNPAERRFLEDRRRASPAR